MNPSLALGVPLLTAAGLFGVVCFAKRDGLHPSFWLALLYLGSAIAALFVSPDVLRLYGLDVIDDDWVRLFGYGVALVAFLTPAMFLRNRDCLLLDVTIVERFAKVSAPLVIFALIYMFPYAWEAVARGALDIRSDLNNFGITLLPANPYTTIAVVTSQFYCLYALMFVVVTAHNGPVWIRVVCMLGSTLYVLNALCFAARDGFVWFLLAYMWALWYARGILAATVLRRLRRAILPVALAAGTIFGVFSMQRFGDRTEAGVFGYMVAYYGSQPYVFATAVRQQQEFYGGRLRFPLFVDPQQRNVVVRTSPYEWSFGTFVKDLYSEGGWYFLAFAVLLGPASVLTSLKWTSSRHPEAYTLISLLYVQFMAQGVFYMRLGMRAGNLYAVCMTIMIAAALLYRAKSRPAVRRVRGVA